MDVSEKDGLTLRSKRLVLRAMTQADAPDIGRISGQPRVARMFLSIHSPWTAEALQTWIDKAAWTGRLGYRLVICLPEGQVIGSAGIGGEPVQLGYFLDEGFTGNGYAQEAVTLLLADAFARFGMDHVLAEHFDDNPGSGHILRKLGFVETGKGQAQSAARLEPAPNTLYRLERAAFHPAV